MTSIFGLSVTVAAIFGAAIAQRTGAAARVEELVRQLGGERGPGPKSSSRASDRSRRAP